MVASTAFSARPGWSVSAGIRWSVSRGIGGQFAPESGGQYQRILHAGTKKKYVSATGFDLVQAKKDKGSDDVPVYGSVSDGSVWEPAYTLGKTSAVMNKLHPFCDQLQKSGADAENIVSRLLNVMAEKENDIIRDRDKKVIEIFRQDVSRELRIRAEKEL
jgi:hypothetical protein